MDIQYKLNLIKFKLAALKDLNPEYLKLNQFFILTVINEEYNEITTSYALLTAIHLGCYIFTIYGWKEKFPNALHFKKIKLDPYYFNRTWRATLAPEGLNIEYYDYIPF